MVLDQLWHLVRMSGMAGNKKLYSNDEYHLGRKCWVLHLTSTCTLGKGANRKIDEVCK